MPKYPEYFVQQVAQATDIVDLIGQYVALTRRGREFIGLCPFHQDHRPSMYVSPAKQIFKCFACGAGGGVFQFLVLYEKVAFPEAVRLLAERAHVPLPREAGAAADAVGEQSKADLAKVMQFAAEFFRRCLAAPQGAAALDYARRRGLSDESIRRFSIGCAPDAWDGLLKAARAKGFGDSHLLAAGLVARREETGGCYDRFRNRLMFPILDAAGRIIAFGGRALAAEERAKYLNSPETVLFDKSSQLYALNWSREAIVACGQAVVVEGYLDALMPLQAGVGNVVATLGTALTDRHVHVLGRYAREVVLVFDADTAGAAAAERGLELFLAQRVGVRVATIPAGKDPCDYVLAEGADALRRLVAEAPDALEHAWSRRQADLKAAGANLAARRAVMEEFLRLVASSASFGAIDEMRRGQLAQHIAHMLNVPAAELQLQMRRLARAARRPGAPAAGEAQPAPADAAAAASRLAEQELLEVLLNSPELFDQAAERLDWTDFADEALRDVARCVWQMGHAGRLTLEGLLAREELAGRGGLVTDLAERGQRRGNFAETLHGAVAHVLYWCERRRRAGAGADLTDEALRRLSGRGVGPDLRRRPRIA